MRFRHVLLTLLTALALVGCGGAATPAHIALQPTVAPTALPPTIAPVVQPTRVPTATAIPPTLAPTATAVPTNPPPTTAPTATAIPPTAVPPTATAVPTNPPPTAIPPTAVPTQAPPPPAAAAQPAAPAARPAPVQPAPPPAAPQPPVQAAGVTITQPPGSVGRNATASIGVRTAPGAACSIVVRYKSGPSEAQGLDDKRADNNGNVWWSWKVGGNTTRGSWPVSVTCNGATATANLTVN